MTGTPEQPFELEIVVDAPTEVVWNVLRDPVEIRRWHGWHFDGLDEEIELVFGPKTTTSEEGKWLEVQNSDRFTLTDLDGRTLVRLTRAPRGNNPDWDAYYDDINEGWTTFLHQLRFAVERHRGEDRATVYLAGDGKVATARHLTDAIGTGERYELDAPTGEHLTGEVWFRSANQLGVTVENWGDGLLIVGTHPVSEQRPAGGAMVLLTTYGLAPDTFAQVEGDWTNWWSTQD